MFRHENTGGGRGHGCGRRFARGFGGGPEGEGRGGEPRFGRGFGRGGPRGRFFDSGDLRLAVLQMIADKPRHGYELIKEIEERLAGAYSPSPGVIYPILSMLEDQGYATMSTEAGGKKQYAITPEGTAHLAENRAAVDQILARIAEAGAAQGGALPQVMRATHNLRMALRMRLGRGALSDEQVRRIVTLLDQAAAEIGSL